MTLIYARANIMNLQATLSSASASADPETPAVLPHHPITCSTELRLEPDGRLGCDHSTVPAGDRRTQSCLNHSLALLLIEPAQTL